MILYVNDVYIWNIRLISHKKLHIKTWSSSKYPNTSCTTDISWTKCLASFCEKYIHILGVLGDFGKESYKWRLDMIQNFCKFFQFFLFDF